MQWQIHLCIVNIHTTRAVRICGWGCIKFHFEACCFNEVGKGISDLLVGDAGIVSIFICLPKQ